MAYFVEKQEHGKSYLSLYEKIKQGNKHISKFQKYIGPKENFTQEQLQKIKEEFEKQPKNTITKIKKGQDNITLKATITDLSPIRTHVIQYTTKNGIQKEKPQQVRTATIKDDTGTINLNLWNKYVTMFKKGDQIKLVNCFAKELKYVDEQNREIKETRITTGKWGIIQRVNQN